MHLHFVPVVPCCAGKATDVLLQWKSRQTGRYDSLQVGFFTGCSRMAQVALTRESGPDCKRVRRPQPVPLRQRGEAGDYKEREGSIYKYFEEDRKLQLLTATLYRIN